MLDMSDEFSAMLKGFATGAGLIIAIGAQNTFVLTQGLARQYRWQVAGLCSLIDIVLISLGVLGLGALVENSPMLLLSLTIGGILFLLVYGAMALRSSLRPSSLKVGKRGAANLKVALMTTLGLSLLNPHVYMDTMLLMGSIGSAYPMNIQPWFLGGAITTSVIWFFSLAYGAGRLQPLFTKPISWRVLDFFVCVLMWGIAFSLAMLL